MELNTQRGFIPNLCDVSLVFVMVLLVELLSIMLALVPSSQQGFWDRLALISLFAQWIGIVNASFLCLFRNWLNQQRVEVCAFYSFTILFSVTLVFCIVVVMLGDYTGLIDVNNTHEISFFILRNLIISGIIYAVVLRYFYVQNQWRSNLQAQSHAQVQALKARIRPHFLFNSMNTIASLVRIDANKAEKAVEDLSDLFRASLQENISHTLRKELDLTASYLDIEHLRLDSRLAVSWQLDEAAMEIDVPTFCIQPVVENAIYHGIEPMINGGEIKISAQLENNRLCLSISNPVDEINSMSRHKGNHMAQTNIKTRLALMYGEQAEFTIQALAESYTVSIVIPIEET